ncbi:hypothetical protein EV193_104397 [Herbihabitans rhizosphaerae]|uniref:Uncharacterized protein n=1 Tax=Herbihabitans rhizosphaerae TaxID=1872711 RepID=A0A4Q7KTM8_9PSEU|nr:hypothetical protein [Herbihabitans rhizosphaerae]RZS39181.1 hypothetical protein EV193_104397 [Herbihabitans rhizosphaerae]
MTALTLDTADVSLLLSVVSFASESDTYRAQDAHLERLYRRLEGAAARINAKEASK